MQNLHASRRFQVERDRFFAAIAPDEVCGEATWPVDDVVVVTGEITAVGVFHLDDSSTEVREHTRAHRCGDGLSHGDDGDARQGCRRHMTIPPSTGSTCPVMYEAASDAMNTNAPATSSGPAPPFRGIGFLMVGANFFLVRIVSGNRVAASRRRAFTMMFL